MAGRSWLEFPGMPSSHDQVDITSGVRKSSFRHFRRVDPAGKWLLKYGIRGKTMRGFANLRSIVGVLIVFRKS